MPLVKSLSIQLPSMGSFKKKRTKTPKQLVKKAKECLQALGPAPPTGEPWMARREGSGVPTPSPSPKNLSSSSQQQQPPLDGSGSSVASTVSTNSSLGLSASNGTGGRSHSSVSLSSLAGSAGPSPRNGNGYGSSFTFSEPPTPTSGGGIKRTNSTVGMALEKGFSSMSSGVSPKNGSSKATPEEEAQRRLVKCMRRMRDMLYGDGTTEPCEKQSRVLGQELIKEDIIPLLLQRFPELPFEARKDTVRVFSDLAFHNWGGFSDPYLAGKRFDVVKELVQGYNNSEVAAKCGTMLRDALRNERVVRHFLNDGDGQIWPLIDNYVHVRNFEVASDAFATLKFVLMGHKRLVAQFLDREFERVFASYRRMLRSDNYVTKRQSLRLLEDILIEPHNFQVMKRFVRCVDNLKAIMMLLRESRSPITQYEAFCIFRIFVVNPHVPHVIARIFVNNKEKLEAYVMKLGRPRRGSDEEEEADQKAFEEEKELIVERLRELAEEERRREEDD